MGAPVLVGAGVGALASLATGRDPFQGAALGGLTGGAFGGSTGFGSGFTEGGLMDLGSNLVSSIPTTAAEGVATSVPATIGESSLLGGGSALQPYNMGSSLLSSTGSPVVASQAGYQAAADQMAGSVFDTPDVIASSGLSTGGGYVPSAIEQETAKNIQQFGGLTSQPQTGMLEGFADSAYESLANMNPLEQAQLGAMTLDAFTPEERDAVIAQAGRITPPKQVTVGTPLAINAPRRTYKPRFA